MLLLYHRDTPTNVTGLRGFPSAPRETGFNAHVAAAYQICNGLKGILMFATIEEARTSMCLSEVPCAVSRKSRISIRSKSKPSLGTIRRNEKGDVLRAGTKWLGERGQGPPVREMVISCMLLQTLEEDSCDVPQKGRSSHGRIVRFW